MSARWCLSELPGLLSGFSSFEHREFYLPPSGRLP